jgi:hypothetical protein
VFESVEKRIATMSEESWKFEYHTIPKTLTESFKELFTGYEHAEKIYRMKPRSEDVWLLTFPKCGE